MSEQAVPRPAATVALLRPSGSGRADAPGFEVLLTQRPSTMAFAPDVHVFPGGAIDPGDSDPRAMARARPTSDAGAGDVAEPAARIAAVRELFEEAGVLLADARGSAPGEPALASARAALLANSASMADVADDLDLELRTDLLAPLSRWVTPPFVERRFDVQFFAAQLPMNAEPSFVGWEVVAHRWLTPRAALDAMAGGDLSLWVPTSTTLQQLEHAGDFDDVLARLSPGLPEPIRLVRESASIIRVVLPGGGAVAGQSVNAYVVGRQELVVIDPGDPSDAAADALLAVAAQSNAGQPAAIRAVVITSAAPHHAAGAEALAGRLGIPIFGGPGVGRDLAFDVTELADGDRLPSGDLGLVAMSTPGPRPDHLAVVAADEAVVFTGDLVGPGPTRSLLPAPDVAAWQDSLERLAALGAGAMLPGQG